MVWITFWYNIFHLQLRQYTMIGFGLSHPICEEICHSIQLGSTFTIIYSLRRRSKNYSLKSISNVFYHRETCKYVKKHCWTTSDGNWTMVCLYFGTLRNSISQSVISTEIDGLLTRSGVNSVCKAIRKTNCTSLQQNTKVIWKISLKSQFWTQ